MKVIFFAALSIASVIVFSFTKNNNDSDRSGGRIAGLWMGSYTINQVPAQGALSYILVIKPDGTLTTESKGGDGKTYYAEGVWTLKGTDFRAKFTTINRCVSTVTQAASMTYDAESGALKNGKWADIINPDGYIDGKFQTFNKVK